MAEVFTRCLILMLCVYSIRESSAESKEKDITEYMDEKCNETMNFQDIGTSERIVKLSMVKDYSANSTCIIKFEAKTGYRLMFKFLSIQMYTCDDYLGVYGDTTSAPDAISAVVCSQPDTVFTTPGRTGHLLFTSDGQGNAGGASILVSMFKTKSGSCGDKHFNCDNDRCIPDDQKCNSRDNCGNNKDEEDCGGWKWWMGMVTGLSVFVVFGIIILKKKGQKKVKNETVQPSQPSQPSTRESWAQTEASNNSENQQRDQHVDQSYPTKTQYWDMGEGGQGQQTTFQSSSFSEPPPYAETTPAPATYTLPATAPPPYPGLVPSYDETYGPPKL